MIKDRARTWLTPLGLYHIDRRLKTILGIHKYRMSTPPYPATVQAAVHAHIDIVRYSSIALALTRIREEGIPGDLAEVGVFQGELSEFLATICTERTLHLFDTFAGFSARDAESPGEAQDDRRFRDTSQEAVRRRLGLHVARAKFHVGWFPDTASELRDERFAFVMLDMDKYKPTYAGLEVFYPRLHRGGYLFLHDYNSPESDRGVARALHAFLADKPELPIELPDRNGSVLLRKLQ